MAKNPNGAEVGVAYVSVIASLEGFKKEVAKVLGDIDAEQAGKKAGQGFHTGFGGFVAKAADQLKETISVAAGITAAGVVTILGAAFKGGLDRLMTKEDAEARMRGLGFAAADVKAVMQDVTRSVQDTRFSAADMASAVSMAMVAGIKPGQQLNGYMQTLKVTSDAAGISLAETGDIFGRIVTNQRATNFELKMLADRGVPIYQLLAKQLGITELQVRDLAQASKIGADDVFAALDNGLGLMSAEMNNTTRAAIGNAKFALARFGEALIGTEFPIIKELALLVRAVLNGAIALVEPIKQAFGIAGPSRMADTVRGLTSRMDEFTAKVKQGGEFVAGIGDKVRGIIEPITKLGALATPLIGGALTNIPMVGKMFGGLTGPLGIIIGLVGTMLANSSVLRGAFSDLGSAIGGAFNNPAIRSAITNVAGVVQALAKTLGDIIGMLMRQLGPTIGSVIETVAGTIGYLAGAITPIIEQAGAMLAPLIGSLGGILAPVADIARDLLPVLAGAFGALLGPAADVLGALADVAAGLVQSLGPAVRDIAGMLSSPAMIGAILQIARVARDMLTGIAPLIGRLASELIPPIIDGIGRVLAVVGPLASKIGDSLWPAVKTVIDWLPGLVDQFLPPIADLIGKAGDAITQLLPLIVDRLLPVVVRIVEIVLPKLMSAIERILPVVIDIVGKIIDAAMPAVTFVLDTIMPVVERLLDFIGPILDNIIRIVESAIRVVSGVIDLVMGIITGDWERAWNGIKDIVGGVWDAIDSFVRTVVSNIQTALAVAWEAVKSVARFAWNSVKDEILAPINTARDTLKAAWDTIKLAASTAWEWVRSTATSTWASIKSAIMAPIDSARALLASAWESVKLAASTAWGWVRSQASTLWGGIRDAVMSPVNSLRDMLQRVWDAISHAASSMATGIKGFFQNAFGGIAGIIKAPINAVISLINGAIGSLNRIKVDIPSWVPGLGGKSFGLSIPKIPMLAAGATVLPRLGGTLAVLAERGKPESVVDTGKINLLLDQANRRMAAGDDRTVALLSQMVRLLAEIAAQGHDGGTAGMSPDQASRMLTAVLAPLVSRNMAGGAVLAGKGMPYA